METCRDYPPLLFSRCSSLLVALEHVLPLRPPPLVAPEFPPPLKWILALIHCRHGTKGQRRKR